MRQVRTARLLAAVTVAAGAVTSIVVNLATDWKSNWVAWLIVGVLVLASTALTAGSIGGQAGGGRSAQTTTHRSGLLNRNRRRSSERTGLVLEILDERPDGSKRQITAYTESSARAIVELTNQQIVDGLEDAR